MKRLGIFKRKNRFFSFITAIVLVFAVLVSLELFLTYALVDRIGLQLRAQAERAFSTIYIAIQDGDSAKALRTMQEEQVVGMSIYSEEGRRMLSLGGTPPVIDLSMLSDDTRAGLDNGLVHYSPRSGNVEYVRYVRLGVVLDTGNLSLSPNGLLPSPIDFPDLLYVVMDGSRYHARLVGTRFLGTIVSLLMIAVLLIVIRFYLTNQRYRQTLARQENLVSLGQAARTLTHEIKNPLSAITLQLAILRKTLPPDQLPRLKVLQNETDRLIQLTNKVSDFLRNPLGSPTTVDLKQLFDELIAAFGRPVAFSCGKDAVIWMDPERARSVFENLLKNAMESTADGRDPQVSVAIQHDKKGRVHVLVMDRGDGISKENGKKIFDPFFTTKLHGSGIGLAISRQFLKVRGGEISLYAREGGGTVAEVIMPEEKQ